MNVTHTADFTNVKIKLLTLGSTCLFEARRALADKALDSLDPRRLLYASIFVKIKAQAFS